MTLHIAHGPVIRGRTQVLRSGALQTTLPASIAVVGVNGSGKSSLFMQLSDTLRRRRRVVVAGLSIAPSTVRYVPQVPALPPWLTARQVCSLYGLHFDSLASDMPALHLDELAGRRTRALSPGQQQILAIAIALAGDASLLIMDEPFSALDFRRRLGVLELLEQWKHRSRQRALLLSSQSAADLLQVCDHFLVIRDGRYIFNGPRSELTDVTGPAGGELQRAEHTLLRLLT